MNTDKLVSGENVATDQIAALFELTKEGRTAATINEISGKIKMLKRGKLSEVYNQARLGGKFQDGLENLISNFNSLIESLESEAHLMKNTISEKKHNHGI